MSSGTASGAITLPVGTSTITVAVTGAGGTATYTIAVTAVSAPSLSGLTLSGGQLSPAFSSGTTTYTLTVHQLAQEAYVKASNTGADDRFGYSVALSGDTLAVGAYFEDSNATGVGGNQADNSAGNSGAVYVFTRSGQTWTQQAYVKASNAGATDYVGYSVALSGDTLAVGALFEDGNATGVGGAQGNDNATDSGAVYVFTRSGQTWTQQAYVKASNTEAGDDFGTSVALSGDSLAVGAPDESSNATGVGGNQANNSSGWSGAVYVLR